MNMCLCSYYIEVNISRDSRYLQLRRLTDFLLVVDIDFREGEPNSQADDRLISYSREADILH